MIGPQPVTLRENYKAWVVFAENSDLPYLKVLKRGFRHCYIIVKDGDHWVSLDPLANHIELQVHAHVPKDMDLPAWLQSRNTRILPAAINRRHKKAAPLGLFTCVETVKRFLGIHDRFIFTPYQLYRYLEKDNGLRQNAV